MPQAELVAALDESASGVPLTEGGGVVQGSSAADDCAGRLDVRTGVEQRVENLDVVAAGGPVQRGLGVGAVEAGVDVGAGGDEHADDGGSVGVVAGPVSGDVQQRARHALTPASFGLAAQPGGGEFRVGGEQALELGQLAGADRLGGGDSERVVGRDRRHPLAVGQTGSPTPVRSGSRRSIGPNRAYPI